MTQQNISSLQAARNWMDSLGMRSYGEVDAAIAKEEATDYLMNQALPDSTAKLSNPWQGAGFAVYAAGLLAERRYLSSDLDDLLDSADLPAVANRTGMGELSRWHGAQQAAKVLVAGQAGPDSRSLNQEAFQASIDICVPSSASNALAAPGLMHVKDKAHAVFAIHLWM